ncbi:RNA recognition motif domain-containing protein [Taibaiella helva]|uniref:RNA recognition motif domain-containing protein n=1 Tax=Taibaiella helva TaxID=2301235 RepID=UPI000E5856F1|nr:RNA-binding protein [Taibaiella helva]
MNIFVGNLTAIVQLKHLRNLFSKFGSVSRVMIIRESRAILPRIFCWVVMKERADALRAIKTLDHSEFMQRTILVNEAVLVSDTK